VADAVVVTMLAEEGATGAVLLRDVVVLIGLRPTQMYLSGYKPEQSALSARFYAYKSSREMSRPLAMDQHPELLTIKTIKFQLHLDLDLIPASLCFDLF
jgi:hypothetical protein